MYARRNNSGLFAVLLTLDFQLVNADFWSSVINRRVRRARTYMDKKRAGRIDVVMATRIPEWKLSFYLKKNTTRYRYKTQLIIMTGRWRAERDSAYSKRLKLIGLLGHVIVDAQNCPKPGHRRVCVANAIKIIILCNLCLSLSTFLRFICLQKRVSLEIMSKQGDQPSVRWRWIH
jgi:hypothetical protein